ncbi:TonB-dependent receptor [Mangrovibacterium diazotrophicum]|uniref:Outer membrane receptor for ferrienterochelin and colicins n=1 Tax=Mangrovibacterium diazotrophicum TaxID=1261403 RepID=A0A419W8R1_9BACT|nr:TonB-dependent receptor [Mangrovibacterium diazotrophicum]RKD91830.1 outer membrane receptor for ferrienterochelin and colicins [Mangrovibacterium diazotrophicum]
MKKLIFLFCIFITTTTSLWAQKAKSDSNIVGHVVSDGEHLPFVTVSISGTTIGTSTDETGHYRLINLPEGKLILKVRSVGYQPQEKEITVTAGQTQEVNFDLQKDILGIDEVVVTGDRNEKNRRESSVIVNTITPKLFTTTNAVTLSEGLNFSPGLRMENDCQNCGFNQVRMNGMEGPYSQILINGRAIFSGLAGVYGLELIPSNMLERIEVVRGGGSALYGSNAIAGTINLILKDPIRNTYEFGINGGASGVGLKGSGDPVQDYTVNANASVVSDDNKSGMAIYGFYRDRQPFDANGDGYSELAKMKNTTFGTRLYHRFGIYSKLSADFFNIKENRRGGDRFDYPKHEANIAEAVDHDITTGALTWEQFVRGTDLWSVYFSGQRVLRDSYYGANQSLADYGNTKGFTYNLGTQYNASFGRSTLIGGIENREEWLKDKKLGYLDIDNAEIVDGEIVSIPHTENTIVADQRSNILGIFAQYGITWAKLNVSLGARFDHYKIEDLATDGSAKSGNVLSPRLTAKYDFKPFLQGRLSYSQGYRAPQVFDEDLHIETSGSRQVIHENDPDLKQETSYSYMASLDFNKRLGKVEFGLLAESFYTKLNDAFVNEYGTPDEDGVVVYTRTNAEGGATVKGINFELNLVPSEVITFKSGFTIQKSEYEEAQEFDQTKFFRTPNNYGYFSLDVKLLHDLGLSSSANYTGKMLVPYFGNQIADPEAGELRESDAFFDFGMKVRYHIHLNGSKLQVFGGMKNIFNSYQKDFDTGVDRDPGYIYGPSLPRTIYFGIKIGNILD